MWIISRNAQRDLMCIGLAVDERTCLLDFFDDERVMVGNVIGKELRADGRANACCVEQVFECNGNAAQSFGERTGADRILGFE